MKKTKRCIIRNEDCRKTIKHMKQKGIKVDCVITSPPYNISRSRRTGDEQRQLKNREKLYKCTRICEYIFVLCREKEYCTFKSNKREIQGKVYTSYSNMFNYFEAKNNDGKNEYNSATFSIEMVANLLNMYVRDNSTVYDPFAGTCTTAVACKRENRNIKCVCSEIDGEQCEYGKERLLNG